MQTPLLLRILKLILMLKRAILNVSLLSFGARNLFHWNNEKLKRGQEIWKSSKYCEFSV